MITRIKYMTLAGIVLLITMQAQAQPVPRKCFDNHDDYSYMWWMKTIKSGNKVFAIKTSRYALAFDYSDLELDNLVINSSPAEADSVLRESNQLSFPVDHPCSLRFGVVSEAGKAWCGPTDRNIDNCQLVESGKYFQRRFMTHFSNMEDFDVYNSGLEISSWPDRFTLLLRAVPETDLENRGLELELGLPSIYSVLIEEGDIKALKNPADGSGFILLKSENATGISVSGTKVTVRLDKAGLCPAGVELNAGLILYPVAGNIDQRLAGFAESELQPVGLVAQQFVPSVRTLEVDYEPDHGWHKVVLRSDGNTAGYSESSNDRIERVRLDFENPSEHDKPVRLNFAKGRLTENGSPVFGITGLSAVLRDMDGNPLGIPVQLSKNWHTKSFDGVDTHYFRGPWYHGLCMLTIPAGTSLSLEYTSVNALWGGIPAASHAQLSLVGWGSNQLWEQSAIGSWGESITYEPDLDQASAPLLDFRPLMIKNAEGTQWGWTGNMGGADFFNYTKTSGARSWHSRMRTLHRRNCPNLTEVSYAGIMDDHKMEFAYSAFIGRSDDLVRGIYHISLNVLEDTYFKDFVFFQAAAPTYHYTRSNTLARGNESGLQEQWQATIGGSSGYITDVKVADGDVPWFSFTDSEFASAEDRFLPANRGIVIRRWNARINGMDDVPPSYAEYNATGGHGQSSSLINILPPAGTVSFKAGDHIDAVIELFQVPKNAGDYYGPNQNLRDALSVHANIHEMVYREALGNRLNVQVFSGGSLLSNYPVRIRSDSSVVKFRITGGRGFVPVTISNVQDYRDPLLYRHENGSWNRVDQEVYGKDFWQSEYHAASGTWEITYNVDLDTPGDVRKPADFGFGLAGSTVGMEDIREDFTDLKIYPNPSRNGNFRINWSGIPRSAGKQIRIVDMQGRTLIELTSLHEESHTVNTDLRSGIYFVLLESGSNCLAKKLIVLEK